MVRRTAYQPAATSNPSTDRDMINCSSNHQTGVPLRPVLRVRPLPQESIWGWALRASECNRYRNSSWILKEVGFLPPLYESRSTVLRRLAAMSGVERPRLGRDVRLGQAPAVHGDVARVVFADLCFAGISHISQCRTLPRLPVGPAADNSAILFKFRYRRPNRPNRTPARNRLARRGAIQFLLFLVLRFSTIAELDSQFCKDKTPT